MRLAVWTTPDPNGSVGWTRAAILYNSSGNFNGSDWRAALWAPMPAFNATEARWHLYYVACACPACGGMAVAGLEPLTRNRTPGLSLLPPLPPCCAADRASPNNASGWFSNYDGRIVHAVSTSAGADGLLGPYQDTGVVLQPDASSQAWEGLQGTDSISPPYFSPNGTLLAWYGSCHSEASLPPAYSHGNRWNVGLVTATGLGQPFTRITEPASVNPVNLNGGHAENPVVTFAPRHGLYLAVFDDLSQQGTGFGLTTSSDGLAWSANQHVQVPGGARTPLKLFLSPDESQAVAFYTVRAGAFATLNRATFNVTFAMP